MRAFVSFERMKFDYCVTFFYFSLSYAYVLVLVSAKLGEWNDSDRFISVQAGSWIVI